MTAGVLLLTRRRRKRRVQRSNMRDNKLLANFENFVEIVVKGSFFHAIHLADDSHNRGDVSERSIDC